MWVRKKEAESHIETQEENECDRASYVCASRLGFDIDGLVFTRETRPSHRLWGYRRAHALRHTYGIVAHVNMSVGKSG